MHRPSEASQHCVLGVDPAATGPTGYAIVAQDGTTVRAVDYGILRHPLTCPPAERLRRLYRLLRRLVTRFSPQAIAVEAVFAAPNIRTALRLAEARGVVLLAGAESGIAVHSYSPREIKLQITGSGRAEKRQMQVMVRQLLGLAEPSLAEDAADALAVALCHLYLERGQRRWGPPGHPAPSLRIRP